MATPEEMIEVLERGLEAYNRGDFESATSRWAPDFEVRRFQGMPELKGADAARQWLEPDMFKWQRLEAGGYRVNGNRVFVEATFVGEGASSGIEVSQKGFQVWTFDDAAKLSRLELYFDRAEALAAAGLDEDE